MTSLTEPLADTTTPSMLDEHHPRFTHAAFFPETVALLRSVRQSRWHASVISSDVPEAFRSGS